MKNFINRAGTTVIMSVFVALTLVVAPIAVYAADLPIDYGSSYSTPIDYGSSYSTPIDYGSSYSTPIDYGSSYSTPIDYGSSYSTPSNYGSSYSTPLNYGSSYSTPSYSTPSYSSSGYSTGGYSTGGYMSGGYSVPHYSTPTYPTYPTYTAPASNVYAPTTTNIPTNTWDNGNTYAPTTVTDTTTTNNNTCTGNSCNHDDHSVVNIQNPAPVINNVVANYGSTNTTQVCASGYYGTYPNCYLNQPAPVYQQPVVYQHPPVAYNAATPYITLSQVPYTGLDLGFWGTIAYWGFMIGFALVVAYFIAIKRVQNRIARSMKHFLFGTEDEAEVTVVVTAPAHASTHAQMAYTAPVTQNSEDTIDSFILSQINRTRHA